MLQELKCVLLIEKDTMLECTDSFNSPPQLRYIESRVYFPFAALGFPADHPSIQDAGVISAV
jgi:hypothetical protein